MQDFVIANYFFDSQYCVNLNPLLTMDFQSPITLNGDSPLHVAVRQGQIEDVREILIQQQVDVNILNSKQETPLHLACSKNDSLIVQLLVAFGADPFIKDLNNECAYDKSAFDVQLLMNELLFDHGLRLWIDGPVQADKESPLHTAVRLGKVDDVQRILKGKVTDINDTNTNHETPLHLACALGHKHIIHILVSYGADIYKKDIFNNAPIHRAVSQGHNIDTVDYLITDCACNLKIKGYQGRTLLHFACGTGNAKMITTLIEKYGISPMATDAVNQTPLHIAASHGQEEVVCLLITRHNLTVDCRSNGKLSPLHLACYCGYVSIVKTLLLTYKADLNALDEFGGTPFLKAALGGNLDLVELMITCFNQDPLSAFNDNGDTPLHIACLGGHKELSRLLITKYNCSAYIENKNKETPLDIARSSDHSSIVRMLVSGSKANKTQQNHFNDSAVSVSAEGEHVETVQALVTEPTGCADRSLLHEACRSESIELAEMLITDFCLDVWSVDDSGNTLLHMACKGGHEELARLLITKYNCPVDIKNKNKKTPLHKACSFGHSSIVRMLVSEFKADATLRDHNNDTAVSKAARGGHVETVQALLTEFGFNPKVAGYDGRSLLHEACWSGSIKLAEMLIIDFSLDVLSTDDSGNTPLHMACWGGHEELARLLITKYNCPVDNENKKKETPLHKACSFGHSNIVRMLISEFKAESTLRDHNNDTAVSKAARGGNVETVQALITELGCSPKVTGYDGTSLLHEACWSGSIKLAEMLISDFRLDVLSANDSGNTPLHMACWGGHEELARLLISKYNSPVDIVNIDKQTPLHIACSHGHLDVSQVLVSESMVDGDKRFYNSLDEDNNTPLDLLIKRGGAKAIHVLSTEYGLKPHVRGAESKPLLHQLAAGGFNTIIQKLLSNFNYDPACPDEDGNTILHIAAQHGQHEIAKFVIINHSNQFPIDHRNCRGLTALHYACMHGHARIIKLVANKALRNEDRKSLIIDECGNTLLHIAAQHGQYEVAKLLIAKYSNQCPIDYRNSQGQTALHCACISGHTRVAKFLVANKADITIRDRDGDTPIKKAFLIGHEPTSFELFDSNLCRIDHKLLLQICERGSVDLINVLLSDFHLDPSSVLDDQGNTAIHIAALRGHKQVVDLLIKKYKCPIDSRNINGQTPLHLLCSQLQNENGHALIRICISEFKADVTTKDNNDDQLIHGAAQAGHTSIVVDLILNHHVNSNSRGFKKQSLLHHALANGHTSTAKTLIEKFHLSLHCVDEDGNTPLHLSSLVGQTESLKFLLYEYHAPVYVRNKAGKTALDLATEDSTKKVIREYVKSEHKRIQREYEKLRAKFLQKYSGQLVITRVFVLGNPGSGKSTLVESLKRKGLSYYRNVPEADVKLHTAGIIPSISQSSAGRLLYFDFAGDQEYYSSHAAILEMVSHSTIGSNVFLIVADLTKDDAILQGEVGYWLSFISYHGKALDSQCKVKVIVVLSHLDRLSVADSEWKLESARQCLQTYVHQSNEVKFDAEIVSSNCRSPRSSRSIESILQQVSKDTAPCSISYEASLLHGLLEKDFGNVVACKFQNLLSSIEEIDIYLPSSADALHPIARELHDIGLLMLIGRSEDELENYLLLLNPSSLTNKVHEKLFSSSAIKKLKSSIGPHIAEMGVLPECYLASILPEHITKECLVQLQYCQEFNHAEVGLDYSVTSNDTSNCNLLYFPGLCELDSKKSSWPKFTFGIGWYAECTEKFDYFPARFLHVLLLRLAYAFALPIVNRNSTNSSNEVSASSRRCTMRKNGIHWLMEERVLVECIVEVVNDNKGIVVITKYKENSEEWAAALSKIIDKAMQAKAEFCDAVSLHHFILKSKSDDNTSYSDSENLFDIHDIERVIRQRKNEVMSVGGHNSLDASHLRILRRHSYWGRLHAVKHC